MKSPLFSEINRNTILRCLNCGYIDIAQPFALIDGTGKCPKCRSLAYVLYEGGKKSGEEPKLPKEAPLKTVPKFMAKKRDR